MTNPTRYRLVPKDGIDVLHRNPGEACNLDDTEAEQAVDDETAAALQLGGFVRLCGHCYPPEKESPLT